MQQDNPHPPQGALRQADGSVVWRVWAPSSATVSLVTRPSAQRRKTAMTPEGGGYFAHRQPQAEEGLRYGFQLADGREYPDPASRWQPEGVHRPSALFSPQAHAWSDAAWRGVPRRELVIYELHVGTFTAEGTFDAIVPRLPQLISLGVTALELMPVAQFPGDRNWGYDGAYPYAVQDSYGGPRGLQRLIDAAHHVGLAVLLDVVYNHLGPEGNYLGAFGPYFTDRYRTPWGTAVNFDGPDSDAVRQFVIDNACAWVRDFHADGLRLDAVHAIYDFSPRHVLEEIQAAVRREAASARRIVHVIAESDQNDVRLVRPRNRGGYGLDGVWSDDFHHAVHALLTGERDGYYGDFGGPTEVAKAIGDVFVYDGCYSAFRRRRHGSRARGLDRTRFVVCMQNHDQVGNRARGERLCTMIPPAAQRMACGLLSLSPCLPLLFMGEEYGEERPFPFFCSFDDPVVVEGVRRGRRQAFDADTMHANPKRQRGNGSESSLTLRVGLRGDREQDIPDPQDVKTFAAAKLAWAWPAGSAHAQLRQLYQDLLLARRRWPALGDGRHTTARLLAEPGSNRPALLLLQRGGEDGLLAVANLTSRDVLIAALELDGRELLLSTEDVRYGGCRNVLPSTSGRGTGGEGAGTLQQIFPYELLVFGAGGRS
jgi:maltooligosyltrehalose trehalohydrolase